MSRRVAALLAFAVLVPASVASVASADHENARGEEICPKEAADNVWPDNPIPDGVIGCTDNELVSPGAHAEITSLEVTTDSCTQDPVLCEVTIEAEAEHWAHQWNSDGQLTVRVVGPTGQSVGYDECSLPFEFRETCHTSVTLEHLAPTEELDTPTYDHEGWPPLDLVVNPQTFCVLAYAQTTPWGTEGHNDEQDEDPARDLRGTCVDVDQDQFNAVP